MFCISFCTLIVQFLENATHEMTNSLGMASISSLNYASCHLAKELCNTNNFKCVFKQVINFLGIATWNFTFDGFFALFNVTYDPKANVLPLDQIICCKFNQTQWKFCHPTRSTLTHDIIEIMPYNMSQPQPWAHDQGKGLEGGEPRRRLESHFTCSQECKECEGMNLHTPK